MSPLVGARLLPLKDCDGWPLAHRELIRPFTSIASDPTQTFFWLVTQRSSPTNDRIRGGWKLSENKNEAR